MDNIILSEMCFKGTVLQRNYRKIIFIARFEKVEAILD